MNELTKQLQEIMVPKAALIAYEYQEGHYASGSHYLELRPINKKLSLIHISEPTRRS